MKTTTAYRFSDFNKGVIKKPQEVRNRLLNQANCKLQGRAFDTRHMDKFIQSRDPAYMAYAQDTMKSGVMDFDEAAKTVQDDQVEQEDNAEEGQTQPNADSGIATPTGSQAFDKQRCLQSSQGRREEQFQPSATQTPVARTGMGLRTKSSTGTRYFSNTVQKMGMTFQERDLPTGAATQMNETGIRPSTAFLNCTRTRASLINQNTYNMKSQKPTVIHNSKVDGHHVDIMGSNMARSLKLTGSTPLMQSTRNKTASNLGRSNVLKQQVTEIESLIQREKSLLSQIQHRRGYSTHKESNMQDSKAEVISMPSRRKQEVREAKKLREEYNNVKEQKTHLKRRMKLIQTCWRNGVVGVDGPDDHEGDKPSNNQDLFTNHNPDYSSFRHRSALRQNRLKAMHGTSDQIDFCTRKMNSRKDPETYRPAERMVMKQFQSENGAPQMAINEDKNAHMLARTEGGKIEISAGWKARKHDPRRFNETYSSYTKPKDAKVEPSRCKELIQGETKGRSFNPLTGKVSYLNNFL